MQALARHADLRRKLGAAAVVRPAVPRALSPHLDDDGSRHARDLLLLFGLGPYILQRTDST